MSNKESLFFLFLSPNFSFEMSTVENITESFDRINFNSSPHQAWLTGLFKV